MGRWEEDKVEAEYQNTLGSSLHKVYCCKTFKCLIYSSQELMRKWRPRALVTYQRLTTRKWWHNYVQIKAVWLQSQHSFGPNILSQQGIHSRAQSNTINSFMQSNSFTHAKVFLMGLFSEDKCASVVRHLYTVVKGTGYRVSKENLNPSSITS